LKESYFSKTKTAESIITEDTDTSDEVEVSPMMEQYINALRKHK